jgi:hypothetical protein
MQKAEMFAIKNQTQPSHCQMPKMAMRGCAPSMKAKTKVD